MFISTKDLDFDAYGGVVVVDEEVVREIIGGAGGDAIEFPEIDSPMNCGLGCGSSCC